MADATPDDADRRAAELTSGLCGLLLKYTWIGPPSMMPPQDFGSVGGDGVIVLTERIAAAIREAVGAERERVCALVYAKGYFAPAPVAVAAVCDEQLDRSGALLGRVRDVAARPIEAPA